MRKKQVVWLAALLCGPLVVYGKDAGWQWYNEPAKSPAQETTEKPAQVRQETAIMQKLATLQAATKRALYEAILYPGTENFVKYFRLQNYWTQQAGLFTMSAKKAMLAHPELDYNLQYSHYNGTVRNQLAADQAEQRKAISQLAERYGIMFFYRGQDPIDGQLAQVINGFRATYGLSVIPVSVDGVINPMLPDTRPDRGQAQRLGVKYFPAMMLVDPKQGSVRPLSYGFITQDDLAKQFLNVSEDFKPNF
ncbi:type-F conjugative transfer system pilin assembly protein TraF [Salmonella enterica]|uniref:Type-F conjugative transfer system pilin assembly protein TraF n=1 Tax=Salmonella enterica TaxID=28901 RepID=A0A5V0SYT9_SALER|nr:type-F conjugative transfer system pilin assembly protein TraF [Salmonella enterica]EDR4274779.1 type-F conjugative transfer system pilin assembly protein TraF [Salmonella enterica subsp. enterica serovar Sandiego]EAN8598912.1 type-F conjugative transfer system pilin assembly protein TraF [Salmonella enterica]EAO4179342.1 type-F conjugative transfer system pilin assembly protein TraF [Salmonella enterica]EAO4344775.1 type-F conjugative transfer system pilin assembly protein TraF [Salmonella 